MDATTLRCWRIGLLIIVALEGAVLAYAAWSLQRFKPIDDGNIVCLTLVSSGWLMAALYSGTLWALIRYLAFSSHLAWGFAAFAGMKLLLECFATVYSAHQLGFYQSGAVLLGYLLGETYAFLIGLRAGRSRAEQLACQKLGAMAAVAIFGATYVCAGTSKVLYGGVSWMDSSTIRLMVASHTEVGTNAWKDAIGHWIAASPMICSLLQVGTIVIQVGSFMMVVSDRWRTVWATLIILFHLGIYFPSNILFVQPLLFAAILAFPWRRVVARGRTPSPEIPTDWNSLPAGQVAAGQDRWWKLSVCLIAGLWIVSPSFDATDLWSHIYGLLQSAVQGT